MKVSIRKLTGNWNDGYALDKHIISSTFTAYNAFGHPQFDTQRTEVGEAVFQLKYRGDWSKVSPLAAQLVASVVPKFPNIGLVVPMPASTLRPRQPVSELANGVGKLLGVEVFHKILLKIGEGGGQALKNLGSKDEKAAALEGRFTVHDEITNDGSWNALIVDDLYDTGASMEAACKVLRTYSKIKGVYVAALTWK